MTKTSTLLEGLTFAEGPRWRSGNLWFSDFYAREVIRVDEAGLRQTVVEVPEQPSGLGWTKDQELLVVSMRDQRVLRLENDILIQHADLSEFSSYWCNDMVVDNKGGAYVGNFGFNRRAGEKACSTTLVRVSPEGKPSLAAEGLWFPNGMVITPDGNTLIVAETFGHRLTAFDVSRDGSLSSQRIFAEHRGMYPMESVWMLKVRYGWRTRVTRRLLESKRAEKYWRGCCLGIEVPTHAHSVVQMGVLCLFVRIRIPGRRMQPIVQER